MKISFNPSNSNKNILDLIKNNKDIIFDLKGHSIFARGVEFKGTDTNTWRDIKINNVSIGSHTLDLRNGSNTTLTNTNGVVTINSTWRPVVDNLTSDSTTSSLSAKQGKVLKSLIDGKSNSDHNHDGRYLRLSGQDAMRGNLYLHSHGTSYIGKGLGDKSGADFTEANIVIRSWWGISFKSYDDKVRTYIDTRTGNIGTKGVLNAVGAVIQGRVYNGGDDEGIIINPASNGNAGLILGTHNGVRSVFYLNKGNSFWRYNNGSTNLDIYHPKKSGTIALTSDIPTVTNYYWANVKISTSSSTTTSPTVHTLTATRVCAGHNPGIDNSISCSNWFRSSGNTGWYNTTYQGGWYMSDTSWIRAHNGVGIYTSGQIYSSSSIRMRNILLEHTDEINNSANGGIHLNYRNSGNVSLCYGGGNVGIGTTIPSYKLDVNGQMRASGFHHSSVNSDNYILLAGGGYKSFGGDDSTPIFLGCLDLDRGGDGTISSSFYCLGYSVPFTYTRGGNYCKIVIPDTTRLSFYIIAATASVNYSGGGMDTWTGYHRGSGAWWLHCYAFGWNEVRVKGFCQADKHNDSWWGGNPLWNNESGANRITVCIFGHVKYK